jgi:hypothetical protein
MNIILIKSCIALYLHIRLSESYFLNQLPIITKLVNSNPVHGEVYSIKFVCDLSQVDGFLRVLRFPPSTFLCLWYVSFSFEYNNCYFPPWLHDKNNTFTPATYVCLSQVRTWISNVIWFGSFLCSMILMWDVIVDICWIVYHHCL